MRRYAFGYGLIGWQEPVIGAWHIAHADLLGSTRLITDGAGNVAGHITYSAFGETLSSDFDTVDARTRYGFCGSWGYETDELEEPAGSIGLIHIGQRYYDPRIGRFIQRDPGGVTFGLNPYSYCNASPAGQVDPSGRSPLIEVLGVAGINGALSGLVSAGGAGIQGGSAKSIVLSGLSGFATGAAATFGPGAGAGVGLLANGAAAYFDGAGGVQIAISSLFGALGGAASGVFAQSELKDIFSDTDVLKMLVAQLDIALATGIVCHPSLK